MSKYPLFYIVLFLLGCTGWDEYPDNPDFPETPQRDALFTKIALELIVPPWSEANMIAQHHFFCDTQNGKPDYNFKEMELDYTYLTYVREWEQLTRQEKPEQASICQALGHFFRARFFFINSRFLGDIPMSEALQADSSQFTPRYDTQKQIMLQVLEWLEEANHILNRTNLQSIRIEGDPFLDGNPASWQKVINSWTIRILINLEKRHDDPDLKLEQRFRKIVSQPDIYPIISEPGEDLVIHWPGTSFYKYPLYFTAVYPEIQQRRFPLASTFINLLRQNQDPRLPEIALPIDSVRTIHPDCKYDYNAYRGGQIGLLKEDLYQQVNEGKISYFNPSRYYTPEGEPTIIIGASEMMFCLAEAINRGLIPGDAAGYYQQGIRFSFRSYGLSTENDTFMAYLERIKYQENNITGLRQIIEQKYIAFFQHSGYEAFFDQRRTHFPSFSTGPQNLNNGQIPKRWRYPEQEYQTNRQHVREAVERQYGGSDDINAKMWIIL